MVTHIVKFHCIEKKSIFCFKKLQFRKIVTLFGLSRQDATLYKVIKDNEGRFPNIEHSARTFDCSD